MRRYSFVAWLRQAGVDPASLSAVHFHGGRRRVGRITGEDLSRHDILFSFTQETRGKLRLEWPEGVDVGDTVDGVLAVALYRETDPPLFDERSWRLAVDGVANATALPGGMRIYLDGRIAGVARRAAVGDEGARLAPLLEGLGVDLGGVRTARLVFGDEGSTTVARERLEALAVRGLPGSGGQLLLAGTSRRVSAVLLER